MKWPNLRRENNLYKKGYQLIAGLDEAGRGAWAGPIVAAAVILSPNSKIYGIKDSKLLTSRKREELFFKITQNSIAWAVGIVSHKIIDQRGINRANILACQKAIERLLVKPDYLLIDFIQWEKINLPYQSIIKGDRKVQSISAASIVAKVTRDHLLIKKDKKYPKYGFARHKGYGTQFHRQMIYQYGLCDFHRKSFRPMREIDKLWLSNIS